MLFNLLLLFIPLQLVTATLSKYVLLFEKPDVPADVILQLEQYANSRGANIVYRFDTMKGFEFELDDALFGEFKAALPTVGYDFFIEEDSVVGTNPPAL